MSDHVRDADAKRHEELQILVYDLAKLNREMRNQGATFDEIFAAGRALARERLGSDYRGQKWPS